MALQRLQKDLHEISRNPPALCTAGPAGDDLFQWNATIYGLTNTPYEGGFFQLRLQFPTDYPTRPPRVDFVTKIFHPNVYLNGHVCHCVVQDKWAAIFTVSDVLNLVCALLGDANPESPANGEAAQLFKSNRAEFDKRAREWTRLFAN